MMIAPTFGDMSRQLVLGRQSAKLKQDLAVLSREMTTGVVSDKARHLNGEFALLSSLESSIELARTRKGIAQSASSVLAVQQSIIGSLRANAQDAFLDLNSLDFSANDMHLAGIAQSMSDRFQDVAAHLNTNVAGRTLFAGMSGDGVAVATPDIILDALLAEIPPDASASQTGEIISVWFAPGGGFDTIGYLGGPPVPARLDLGNGLSASLDVTAQHDGIRQTLSAFAKGAVLVRGLFDTDPAARRDLLRGASGELSQADAALVALSSRTGMHEERVTQAISRAEAEHSAMLIARTELLAADPYDAATRLEHAMSRLELIHHLTARLSRLTLADYLR